MRQEPLLQVYERCGHSQDYLVSLEQLVFHSNQLGFEFVV
jgi:hypothetical protein